MQLVKVLAIIAHKVSSISQMANRLLATNRLVWPTCNGEVKGLRAYSEGKADRRVITSIVQP